jgi:hypothetical protein
MDWLLSLLGDGAGASAMESLMPNTSGLFGNLEGTQALNTIDPSQAMGNFPNIAEMGKPSMMSQVGDFAQNKMMDMSGLGNYGKAYDAFTNPNATWQQQANSLIDLQPKEKEKDMSVMSNPYMSAQPYVSRYSTPDTSGGIQAILNQTQQPLPYPRIR